MEKHSYTLDYTSYDSAAELDTQDASLMEPEEMAQYVQCLPLAWMWKQNGV